MQEGTHKAEQYYNIPFASHTNHVQLNAKCLVQVQRL